MTSALERRLARLEPRDGMNCYAPAIRIVAHEGETAEQAIHRHFPAGLPESVPCLIVRTIIAPKQEGDAA